MCGLSGYFGLSRLENVQRAIVLWALGEGSDRRGGHAAGLAAFSTGHGAPIERVMLKKLGNLVTAEIDSFEMIRAAAQHDTVLLHTRYATTEAREVHDAHPFEIVRDGEVVLVGMHNGIIYNAREMAHKHGRPYTVDSREMFEILADALKSGDYSTFSELQGYGVIVWTVPTEPECVFFCRLSDDGDLVVASLKGGGLMWGSTHTIVDAGLEVSGLEVDGYYKISTGKVMVARNGELYATEQKLTIGKRASYSFEYYASRGISRNRIGYDLDWNERSFDFGDLPRPKSKSRRKVQETAKSAEDKEKERLCRSFGLDRREIDKIAILCEEYDLSLEDGASYGLDELEELVEKFDLCDEYGLDRSYAHENSYAEMIDAVEQLTGTTSEARRWMAGLRAPSGASIDKQEVLFQDEEDEEFPITLDVAEDGGLQ